MSEAADIAKSLKIKTGMVQRRVIDDSDAHARGSLCLPFTP